MNRIRTICYKYFLSSKEDYKKVRTELCKENRDTLHILTVITTAIFACLLLGSLVSERLSGNMMLYLVLAASNLVIAVLSFLPNFNTELRIGSLVHSYLMVQLFFGIATATLIKPGELTVSFIVMMIATPILLSGKPIITNLVLLLHILFYFLIARETQSEEILFYNTINVCAYGAVSMILTSFLMKIKIQRILFRLEKENLEISEKEQQVKKDNYDSFIADMIRYASAEGAPEDIIRQILCYIGQKVGADRAYIVEKNSDQTYSNTYEWCKEGVTAEKENMQHIPGKGMFDLWFEELVQAKNVQIRDVSQYQSSSKPLYELLKAQAIQALVVGPITVGGKTVGFYGVDNPPEEKMEEISNLIEMMGFVMSMMLQLRNNMQSIEKSATHDLLTGCRNRIGLEWAYDGKFRPEESCGIVMCDLNGLKTVNDNLGHLAGDRFISESAECLKQIFGADNVYRIGGDEFLVVLTGISEYEFIAMVEKCKKQMDTKASIGMTYEQEMVDNFDFLFKKADQDMYQQKSRYYIKNNRRKGARNEA